MKNMANVIQNLNTNLLKDPVVPTGEECICQERSNCPLAEKCLSERLLYHAQVDRYDINQTKSYYRICKTKNKNSKSVTTTIRLLLAKNSKEESTNLSVYLGVEK